MAAQLEEQATAQLEEQVAAQEKTPLLSVKNLTISFRMYDVKKGHNFSSDQIDTNVINSLSLEVGAGELVAIVGASGSGKTLLADAILGIFDPNETVYGTIEFEGRTLDASALANLRGHNIAYIPQSVNALDPLMRVGKQVRLVAKNRIGLDACVKRQRELFARYGLQPSVEKMFPHELSGGMARRVLLCCELMENPKLLVADEPTPGLDAKLADQAMMDLRALAAGGCGVLLITHDIALALKYADRIAVFADGTVVEEFDAREFTSMNELMSNLRHPFSQALLNAMPEQGLHENMDAEAHL